MNKAGLRTIDIDFVDHLPEFRLRGVLAEGPHHCTKLLVRDCPVAIFVEQRERLAKFCSKTFNTCNRFPVLQISMFLSSSQDLVAASGRRRPAKPPGALCIVQSTTTCCTDCVICLLTGVEDVTIFVSSGTNV